MFGKSLKKIKTNRNNGIFIINKNKNREKLKWEDK